MSKFLPISTFSYFYLRTAVVHSMAVSAASFVGTTSAVAAQATTAAVIAGTTATTIGATSISTTTAVVSH